MRAAEPAPDATYRPMDYSSQIFFLALLGLWGGISLLLAWIGGWASLAKVYRAADTFSGNRWWCQSARMQRFVNYNNSLVIGANKRGLYLSIVFIFRMGHPPLFVPWDHVTIQEGTWFHVRYLEFRFRRNPAVPLRISRRLGEKMAKEAGHWWPGIHGSQVAADS